MFGDWRINSWPKCEFHVFLSHCAEDRDTLVKPVFKKLQTLGIIPWVDWHHYPAGTNSFQALREGILKCRHIAYLITPQYINQSRGWTIIEKAYGGLIQNNLSCSGNDLQCVELPLFLMPPNTVLLDRKIWEIDKSRGKFLGTLTPSSPAGVDWVCNQIKTFVAQEQSKASQTIQSCLQDPLLKQFIQTGSGKRERIEAASP